jgi:hypothetical protein
MSMIFPGMDPYLEDPQIWQGVHASLAVYIRDQLQPKLRPRYIAALQERVFVEGPDREITPDVWLRRSHDNGGGMSVALANGEVPIVVQVPALEIHEAYLEILDRQSGMRVVTVIEVVSPTNKFAGPGRKLYSAKQQVVLTSQAHLVEIDLLRAGPHVLAVPEWAARGRCEYHYLTCVSRAKELRDTYELYPRRLPERLPRIRIPLAEGDPDVVLDVQAVLEQAYEAGSYRDRLNYDAPCAPPLSSEDQVWANEQIENAQREAQP